jgi:hypothetical protein
MTITENIFNKEEALNLIKRIMLNYEISFVKQDYISSSKNSIEQIKALTIKNIEFFGMNLEINKNKFNIKGCVAQNNVQSWYDWIGGPQITEDNKLNTWYQYRLNDYYLTRKDYGAKTNIGAFCPVFVIN